MTTKATSETSATGWKDSEKDVFCFVFLYFALQSLPLSLNFFGTLFSINWLNITYEDIFNLTRFSPAFLPGAETYWNWIIVAAISLIGAFIWKKFKADNYNFDNLYYWLRVIVRYRLAIAVIGYGIIKVFPLQAPFPSISNLNTSYGDFDDWKIFSLSLGVVPSYESFLGWIELLSGILLFFRKTSSIAAVIILIFAGNVFISNVAYDGGEFVYSLYIQSLALFVLFHDALRIHRLVSLEKPAEADKFNPVFEGFIKKARPVLKAAVIFFFVFLYGFKTYSSYKKDSYQFPKAEGLANSSGLYNVKEFKLNGKVLPYSATDDVRWKDVVFEKWPTISIRSNRPVIIQTDNYEHPSNKDEERNYEQAGSGGRHYYSYTVDSVNHVLELKNKNSNYRYETLQLGYRQPNDSTFVLSGVNERHDSVYVVLEKSPKKYLLTHDRRRRVKL